MVKKYLIKRSQVVAILIFLVEIIGSFALVQIDASENILGKIGYVAIIYGVLSTIALYQVKKEWDVFLIFMIMCYLFSFGQCILTAFSALRVVDEVVSYTDVDATIKTFALVQVIPATFRSDCVPMYDLYREGKLNFDDLFNGMIYDRAVPNVDGVYFPDYSEQRNFEQLQIFNTGAVELKMDFEIREQNSRSQQLKTERYLIIFDFEAELRKLIQGTSKMYQKLGRSTAMYVCVTIVGCKGLWNYTVNAYGANAPTKVDRNQIVCTPIEIRNIQDDVQVKEGIENCIRMTKYSLGIRI